MLGCLILMSVANGEDAVLAAGQKLAMTWKRLLSLSRMRRFCHRCRSESRMQVHDCLKNFIKCHFFPQRNNVINVVSLLLWL